MSNDVVGSVMVVGGGIAGIQASLDLAQSGYKVYMVEKTASIGGVMAMLDKTFPTNDCSMCIMSPKLVEVGRHPNIELITLAEIQGIEGAKGDFTVNIRQAPRYVDTEKCIACGQCAAKCPKKVTDEYNQGLIKRKAIYVPYPQAVPLKFAIDPEQCLKLTKDKCGNCERVCPAGAILYDDKEKILDIHVGSVILAPGFSAFDPKGIDAYAMHQSRNVMTSLEFERILSASGPTGGHLVRPSDSKEPLRIAWLQCVGSRDINRCGNSYCSSVCCMYAIKQAIIAKEHAPYELDCSVFYMDMRTHGKGFEDCYNEARDKHGVDFKRARVHTIDPNAETGDLNLRYVDEDGNVLNDEYDLVVLSVGLEISDPLRELAGKMGVELTPGGFGLVDSFSPVASNVDGIYLCGAFAGPKDIPQSVVEAGSAALMAGSALTASRDTLTVKTEMPPEVNIKGEPPRVGVFVCQCGINIGGVVDVPAVRDYAATLPYVEFSDDNLYSCSQDTQDAMTKLIKEKGLNRIVVAACSPKTHEPLFQETLSAAGLNKYLFEFVNIRNQDSWVHKDDPKKATEKAKDLLRMAVAKVALLSPLEESQLLINQHAMVIGGGISGIAAAQALSAQGYETSIVERDSSLGGQARSLFKTAKHEDIQEKLGRMIQEVEDDPNITVHLNAELADVTGFVGAFQSTVKNDQGEYVLDHGVTIVATGAYELEPTEYLYGQDPRILTGQEMDRKMIENDAVVKNAETAVFIQCVGSREPSRPYCSRLCCTHSVLSALHLKEMNPDMQVYVLYRDIRTYGERENLYKEAREKGVIFIRYSVDDKPKVSAGDSSLTIEVRDPIAGLPLAIKADLLTLASAVVPYNDERLAQQFKLPLNDQGFFVEAHVKLAPSSFATDGVFLCGLAHYPKPIDEAVAQAQAAASAAVTLLSRKSINTSANVAKVDPRFCSSCMVCVSTCPYSAPSMVKEGPNAGKAEINPVLCKGCGQCVASCRSGALHLQGFDTDQILAQIREMCAV
ncbi:heterodisulfide reductase subunit A [Desulfatibacillum alkenivorans DSM 16219]|uniref:Heterodisulfide reductase subunit A n=1 Tax=Desulfatibacillum alkenivorans DSM 16219 TaxID=1121393 RepID=A0A1M6J7T1_9BACT|nr:FAD-dependent oxidoreductase [Desulfatibacillum alkenivorans]SHJ42731.1 heterodisulfide reductase subunit A [Desulfatibacillum alkenivorans DSM 16219]